MLRHPTLEKLQTLRLTGMVAAFQEHLHLPDVNTLSFEERLGLLVDRELLDRENRILPAKLVDFSIDPLFWYSVTREHIGGRERGWTSRTAMRSAISRPFSGNSH
jgi:IstB-like ATP binding protein